MLLIPGNRKSNPRAIDLRARVIPSFSLPAVWLGTLALGFSSCLDGETNGSPQAALNPAPLEFSTENLEFEPIPFGQSVEGAFEFVHRGEQPLRIERIGPASCSCSALRLELPDRAPSERDFPLDPNGINLVLSPGERGRIFLTLNTARFRRPASRKIGSLPIFIDGYPPVLLEWGADIWVPYWPEPWDVQLGTVGIRERPTGYVVVKGHDDQKFELLVPKEIDGWELTLHSLGNEEHDFYRIDVRAPEELPQGPFYKEFRLQSTLPDGPPVKFAVQGIAEPDLTWTPKRLLLRAGERPAQAQMVIVHRSQSVILETPQVELQGAAAALLEVQVSAVETGKRFLITVTSATAAPEQTLNGELRVRTNDAETAEFTVPITVLKSTKP